MIASHIELSQIENTLMIKKFLASTAFSALLGFIPTAQAANTMSVYTDFKLEDCLVLQADDFGASFACPGYMGYPLYVAEGDLRFFVSYGFGAKEERAASQTLPAFNTLHTTLEWRLTNVTGDWKPFATILRWFTDSGDGETPVGETLIVTKIEEGNTCHVAYVDAKTIKNANEVAQEWADKAAPDFDCATQEPHVIAE